MKQLTKDMKERATTLGTKWIKEGSGYFALIGCHTSIVAYIALPKGHPDISKSYNDLRPNVNGGLTFGEGNVYGWDYGHAYNYGTPEGDIKNALKYFKRRLIKTA